jgi:hypothetical protein
MTTTAIAAHTTEERLYAASELVSRFNVTATHVLINERGITIRGVAPETIHDLTPALALRIDDAGVGHGETFDGIPVTVEQRRQ